MVKQTRPEDTAEIISTLVSYADDPLGAVMFGFPWGEVGGPLEKVSGPRVWQRETLEAVGEHTRRQVFAVENELEELIKVFKEAIASGRGIGKSALFGMLCWWGISCHVGASAVVTANTEAQLRTKTFPEFKRWFTMAINSNWWDVSSLAVLPHKWISEQIEEQLKIGTSDWGVFGSPWSKENPDAYAGKHNMYGLQVFFDEASGIPANIWDVSDGFFTELNPYRQFIAFSQGRRNSGRFYDLFHNLAFMKHWRHRQIDARTIAGVDRGVLNQIIDTHGEESDQARIEVYGQFPEAGSDQFIPASAVRAGAQREVPYDPYAPLIMGVDPAPRGRTVIRFRAGRDARSIPPVVLTGVTHEVMVKRVIHLAHKYHVDAIAVDHGHGIPLIQALKKARLRVYEVNFGAKSLGDSEYSYNRTALWGRMKKWLVDGGCIDGCEFLRADLLAARWKWAGQEDGKKILISKEAMAQEGIPSPDDGDALAITFYPNVARKDAHLYTGGPGKIAQGVGEDVKM